MRKKKREKKHLVGEGVSASEEAIGDGSLSDLKAILSMMLMNDSKKVLFFLRYFIYANLLIVFLKMYITSGYASLGSTTWRHGPLAPPSAKKMCSWTLPGQM